MKSVEVTFSQRLSQFKLNTSLTLISIGRALDNAWRRLGTKMASLRIINYMLTPCFALGRPFSEAHGRKAQMMQKNTNVVLYTYWDRVRAGKPFALRSAINPGDIRSALPFVFILERVESQILFRLAGTHLCTVFQRELRGHPFSSIWADNSAAKAEALAFHLMDTSCPISIGGKIALEGDANSPVTILLLPVSQDGKTCSRLIGAADFGYRRYLGHERAIGGIIMTRTDAPVFAAGDDNMEKFGPSTAQQTSVHAVKQQPLV